jgi:putative membrane protein
MLDWILTRPFVKSVEAIHVFSVISWMAGMLYLPRLFVYHSQVSPGSESDTIFKTMERKLYYYIMAPALVAVVLTGSFMTYADEAWTQIWWYAKISAVLCMLGLHFTFGYHRKLFTASSRAHSHKFYRIINEVPAVLMLFILIMVVVKPYRGVHLFGG